MDTLHAYFAGAIDSDGFITIGRKTGYRKKSDGTNPVYYVAKIGISQTSPIIPDMFHQHFPAWRGEHQPKNPNHKKWFIWQASNGKAEQPIRAVLPYLKLKQRQAELALEFIELIRTQNSGRWMGNEISDDEHRARGSLFNEITKLNAPRNRRIHLP